ncbi:Xaa-Pro peptidase family protein [Lacticaseibacillus pabuli]|uniref:Xaa-Pro peptidase family protein n=1 Tax=Lacticaseibacillus pabuli TaxID=3025672 RepID=A0ABY7WX67_9LACO|nr:Xaa-Pro peptidase family protein [Lacticaseibacillus sp. KACC 23028]WDF83664.1 Xaa-Pro peptidase family protein [Lacticaseibacillus sp. KACC 23028]
MDRIKVLEDKLSASDYDALLLTDVINVQYATGFTGDESAVLITKDGAILVTDSRYTEQAQQEVNINIVLHVGSLLNKVAELAEAAGAKTLGFEADAMNYSDYASLNAAFDGQLVPTTDVVESMRQVKDADETALIKKAIAIAEMGYQHVLDTIKPGMKEIDVATDLDFYMRKQGASGTSFETIVASGARSAMPHGSATDRVMQDGDIITLDWGCVYGGYVSDLTRTFALGKTDPKLDEIYRIVFEANRAVAAMMAPGVTGRQIHEAAHQVIDGAGYKQYFGHGTGHGIGRGIHEGPGAWGRYMTTPQLVGNIETDEPGIYIPDLGGVRIEDDLLITADGNQQLSTVAPAELLHL